MNRRSFISTLTALASIVLATRSPSSHKIKAPVAPIIKMPDRDAFLMPNGDMVSSRELFIKSRQLGNTHSQLGLLEYYRQHGKFPS